jgi:CBS domain containing-hemolysin-like protein
VHFPGFEMEVLSVDGPRVENVRIRPVAREEPD